MLGKKGRMTQAIASLQKVTEHQMLQNLSIASQVALSPLEAGHKWGTGIPLGVLWRDRFGMSFQLQSNRVALGAGARSRARPSCACLLGAGLARTFQAPGTVLHSRVAAGIQEKHYLVAHETV